MPERVVTAAMGAVSRRLAVGRPLDGKVSHLPKHLTTHAQTQLGKPNAHCKVGKQIPYDSRAFDDPL